MKSMQDAVALCEKERDNFYVTAFMIEAWLGQVVLVAAAEYAEKKDAKERRMQAGQAWQGFQKTFGHATDQELPHVLESLCRYGEYDGPLSEMLRKSAVPLSMEHDGTGQFVGPKTTHRSMPPKQAAALISLSIQRWCEWLDAVVHWQTHETFHLSAVSFDADAEKRELAALGINQRGYAHLGDSSKAWWQWHHGEAAERFKDSAKWPTVGKAMASQEARHWNYPEMDAAVISLWPLLQRHNWTYRDLLNVVREVVPQLRAYPCEREQDLAAYCNNVLGLRKSAKGNTATDGQPKGHDVALRLFRRQT